MKKRMLLSACLMAGMVLCNCARAELPDVNPTLGLDSAYSVTELTSSEGANFLVTDGTETKYYRINLNLDKFGGTQHTTFSTDSEGSSGHIDVILPKETTARTVYYTYTKPSGYGESDTYYNWDITSDYVNHKLLKDGNHENGGAIYNDDHKDKSGFAVNADFYYNHAWNNSGGAIWNNYYSKLGDINGDFVKNYANNDDGNGGAILNQTYSIIGDITGDFVENFTLGNNNAVGGAIKNENYAEIGNIIGNFVGNYAQGNNGYAYGGAIRNNNSAKIGNISGHFIGNYAKGNEANGGAIVNDNSAQIGDITGDFIGNYASSSSGIAQGGAIANHMDATIGNITGDFIGNYASGNSGATGGAIYNTGTIGTITGDFIGNTANNDGGAIYNISTITNGIKNASFINNKATTGRGGAIYTSKNLTLVSDSGDTVFLGNTANGESNAIYMDKADGSLTFDIKNGGSTYMYDAIDGQSGYNVVIQGADKTADIFYLFNDIKNAGTVSIGGVELNTINNNIHTYDFNTLNLASNFNMAVDVDLAAEKMDRLTATSVTGDGFVNVVGLNLMTDATKDETKILFADENLADKVTSDVFDLGYGASNPYQTTAYAPIYKYTAIYNVDSTDNKGYYEFLRSSGGGSDDFNPAVLASPVAAQIGGMASQWNSYEQAFINMDMNMLYTREERKAMKYANRYASAATPKVFSETYLPEKDLAGWARPYASFEKVDLRNGPSVNNTMYGMFFGGDSEMYELKHNWDFQYSVYAGYNGSRQSYNDVTILQNGGTLGATGIFYHDNFFTALTANVGASVANADTMFGHEDFPMLMTGVASKTGYNLEMFKGKFIIQPSWLMSYSFVNTFNYKNAAGVRVESDGLHAIQLAPQLKFIGNLPHGWQPYASIQMVWNIMDETKFRANNVSLPYMSIKPYIQYGVGVQKRWGERFTGFFQTMIRNGGRTGVAFTLGFRWALGSLRDNNTMGNRQNSTKTVIKETTPQAIKTVAK